MKKILISVVALCSTFTLANKLSEVHHRVEMSPLVGVAFKDDTLKAFQRYIYVGGTYMPEREYVINETRSLTVAPRFNFGLKVNVAKDEAQVPAQQANGVMPKFPGQPGGGGVAPAVESPVFGVIGGIGAEVDYNIKMTEARVAYIGLDTNLQGIGYIDFGGAVHEAGVAYDLGLSVGGKFNENLKVGARVGYELEGVYERPEGENKYKEDIKIRHNLTVGMRFGIILGK